MMRNLLMPLFIMTVIPGLFAQSAQPKQFVGTWEGTSLCTIPTSPCHNEDVIYRVTEEGSGLKLDMDKVVNGQQENMGALTCKVANATTLHCNLQGRTDADDFWEFKLSGRRMTGTLTVPSRGGLFRKIDVTKK